MRHPFYMDDLNQKERRLVKRLLVRILAIYFSLAVILVGGSIVRAKFNDPPADRIQNADFR
jgi:hypothetical protein